MVSSRQGRGSGGVEVPTPSIARFGRLAGLDSGKATTRKWAQTSKPWLPGGHRAVAVGATWRASKPGGLKSGLGAKRMTTAPKKTRPHGSRCAVIAVCRPGPFAGKADVSREETSACTLGTAGVRVPASGERSAEITSGTSWSQQGLTATCEDSPHKVSRN